MAAILRAIRLAGWPWLFDQILNALLIIMLVICGLFALAAVTELTVDCQEQTHYLLASEKGDRPAPGGGWDYLLAEPNQRSCPPR